MAGPLKTLNPGRSNDVSETQRFRFPTPSGSSPPPRMDVGMGPQMPPRGEDASEAPFTRLVFPPRIEKLTASRDFNVQDYQMALPGVVGASITSAALRFQVPKDQFGWLQQFTLYVLTPTANTRVRWQVRINEGPVPGFDNIENPPGIANFILIGYDDLRVRIPTAASVDVLITNLSANAEVVGAALAGWYHPEAAELRAWNADI